jgi:hypothetical protein
MSEQKTFSEIVQIVFDRKNRYTLKFEKWLNYTYGLSWAWIIDRKGKYIPIRKRQSYLFGILGVLADYFNGENNWVPEGEEVRYYPHTTYPPFITAQTLYFLPAFKRLNDVESAMDILETEFPELIESFTKQK